MAGFSGGTGHAAFGFDTLNLGQRNHSGVHLPHAASRAM
jgi:hypothetical protein